MYWRTAETTLKTLLMEVFFGPTPTYSGNYKANLESFPVEYALAQVRACRGAPALIEAGCEPFGRPGVQLWLASSRWRSHLREREHLRLQPCE